MFSPKLKPVAAVYYSAVVTKGMNAERCHRGPMPAAVASGKPIIL
jgi:hypothetical protein